MKNLIIKISILIYWTLLLITGFMISAPIFNKITPGIDNLSKLLGGYSATTTIIYLAIFFLSFFLSRYWRNKNKTVIIIGIAALCLGLILGTNFYIMVIF